MFAILLLLTETWACSTHNLAPCIFPFQHEEKTYHGCIKEGTGYPWCAIDAKNKSQGSASNKNSNYKSKGVCNNDCPGSMFPNLIKRYLRHIILIHFSACSNGTQLYNIWGLTNCSSPYKCKPGYGGNACSECTIFNSPVDDEWNGVVDPNTGQGVVCECKL